MAITGSAADSIIRIHRCSLVMLNFVRKYPVDFERRRPCPNSRPQPRGEWSRRDERGGEREQVAAAVAAIELSIFSEASVASNGSDTSYERAMAACS